MYFLKFPYNVLLIILANSRITRKSSESFRKLSDLSKKSLKTRNCQKRYSDFKTELQEIFGDLRKSYEIFGSCSKGFYKSRMCLRIYFRNCVFFRNTSVYTKIAFKWRLASIRRLELSFHLHGELVFFKIILYSKTCRFLPSTKKKYY